MSLAQDIAPQIPLLRRYARALTGSQKGGDAYVAAVLEALLADPGALDTKLAPRVALYQMFSSIWQTVDINLRPEGSDSGEAARADMRLEAITPKARQAFLLKFVEDFSLEETATILGMGLDEVTALIDDAGSDLALQVATDVLIIEDEPIIAIDLEELVTDLGHRVFGIARTHAEAMQKVKEQRPGLVLADIQLADGSSGLDAVNEMLVSMGNIPVVFITAYPERLLTGDRPEPAFLVTKPFQHDMVKAIISQVLFFEQKAAVAEARVRD